MRLFRSQYYKVYYRRSVLSAAFFPLMFTLAQLQLLNRFVSNVGTLLFAALGAITLLFEIRSIRRNNYLDRHQRLPGLEYQEEKLEVLRNTRLREWIKEANYAFEVTGLYRLQTGTANAVYQLEAKCDMRDRADMYTYAGYRLFYTAVLHPISRELPHVFFKSIGSRSKLANFDQYAAQSIKLEAGFYDRMTMYAPMQYNVDVMSYITPEVMQVLLKLKSYDIEIRDAQLIVYTPLLTRQQLAQVEAAVTELAAALNDNIDNYHDSYASTGSTRSQFSQRLLLNPINYANVLMAIFFAVGGGYLAYIFGVMVLDTPRQLHSFGDVVDAIKVLLGALLFIFLAWAFFVSMLEAKRKNRRKILRFKRHIAKTARDQADDEAEAAADD